VPTISDLKDQARTLEQQGQFEKALTIYQHILKHLEGTPALAKVLPLYVKAGDLLHKMDRQEEAVASYQTAAEQYAASGAAPRVTALCGKIIRLVPERRDVYTDFVRQLIDHGHVGSARDVLADYARYAGMDRAIETLDDLAGRQNSEVQPMLERLLNSFELDDQSEQAAERVSTQLEQVTDSMAGELAVVPDASDGSETAVEEEVSEDEDEEDTDTDAEDFAAADEAPAEDDIQAVPNR
jgi:tetratricopeptide (TPR) repeat protein